MNKRERFRKTTIRELLILTAFVAVAAVLIIQARWVDDQLQAAPVLWRDEATLEQNLAALGLAGNEINAVMMMEDFKRDFPQFAKAGYKDAVGFYLAEFPAYPHREALYDRITAAENKINEAKQKLTQQQHMESVSQWLKRAGVLILALYPLTFGGRVLLRIKRVKAPKFP